MVVDGRRVGSLSRIAASIPCVDVGCAGREDLGFEEAGRARLEDTQSTTKLPASGRLFRQRPIPVQLLNKANKAPVYLPEVPLLVVYRVGALDALTFNPTMHEQHHFSPAIHSA